MSIAFLMQHPSLIQITMAENASISATYKQQLLTHLQQKSAGSATGAPVIHYLNTLTAAPVQAFVDEVAPVGQVATSSITKGL